MFIEKDIREMISDFDGNSFAGIGSRAINEYGKNAITNFIGVLCVEKLSLMDI